MTTYVMLSRMSPDALKNPKEFKKLAGDVAARIKSDCPGVVWKASYGTLGRFDVVDIVEADDPKMIARVALILRAAGHETTETLVATPWPEFIANL